MLRAYRRIFVIWHGYRRHLVLCQVLLLISGAASIGMATLTQKVINQGLVAGDTTAIVTTGIWMAVLALVSGGAMAVAAAIAVFFMQGTAWVMRTELYSKLQDYSFENYDRIRTGDLLTRLSSDIDNVSWAVLYGVLLILYAPFMLVIAFVLTIFRSPSLVWLLLVATGLVIGMMAVIAPIIFKAYVARQERLDDVNATLQESLTGVRVVKAFTREKLEEDRAEKRAAAMRKPAFTAAFTMALMQPLINASAQAMILVSVWYGGWRVLDGHLNLGELIAFTQYLSLVAAPLAMLAIIVPFILRGGASIERLLEAYDAVPAVQDKEGPTTLEPADVKGRLAFEDVSFAFRRPDGNLDPPALKHISLTLEPGERVGILGATGAGKTALVNLVPRFYDVTEGRITIDGVDVRDIPQDNLRQLVGIALQEAVLFQGDVRFNLKFGAPDVDDDVMKAAAAAADADEFVDDLPERWEAPVSSRGNNFSGGQRQRLSMARTLTPLPRILILDDSTSALDVATESRVQEAIPEFAGHATTLYVAQRISAVIDLDKVVLMDRGEITDIGSHEELMERSALYREIYESQLGAGLAPAAAGAPA
jgi:ATP-binding cassette, subfamily B, bacterial